MNDESIIENKHIKRNKTNKSMSIINNSIDLSK